MNRSWVALLLVSTVLAGCSDSGGGGDELEDPALGNIDVAATETTGVIRGVVVDAAIRPIVGAIVTVPLPGGAQPLTVETDESGAFGFQGLQPGPYFVKVAKIGYFDQQQSVDVVAGVDEPPAVKILLEVNVEATPFYEEYTFDGFIECTTGVAAVCGAPNLLTGSQITNDRFSTTFEMSPNPEYVQVEMVWQSTQALTPDMYFEMESDPDFDFYGSAEGPSPIMANITAEQAASTGLGGTNGLYVSIFSGGIDDDAGGPGVVGVTVQQEFTIFVHAFYAYTPPEGWRFTADGDPPVPT
ncbi:MAG: carboxypeptidase-like regulatory domain-containing protein [Thermoplasmatota archaeon]